VLDGTNDDDRHDYRPGQRAVRECGVRSPLAELGLGKAAVRALARRRGLPNWNDPACACLASRIPYGEEITPERIARVGRAEEAVRTIGGFRQMRVRDHGTVARIELGPDELGRALDPALRQRLSAACKAEGFLFVCLDLDGYRTGSLNEALPDRPPGPLTPP
jgi:pyridinium-3,5-biscarboxylic acid mononucleotide sulfurtransferase